MPRTTAIANSNITQLENKLVTEVYRNADYRSRGVTYKDIPLYFSIFVETLEQNQTFNILTPIQRDSIIDFLAT